MVRRKFTQEFKLEAVRLLTAGHRPASEIGRELGINPNLLYKWKRQMAENPEALLQEPAPSYQYWPEKQKGQHLVLFFGPG